MGDCQKPLSLLSNTNGSGVQTSLDNCSPEDLPIEPNMPKKCDNEPKRPARTSKYIMCIYSRILKKNSSETYF